MVQVRDCRMSTANPKTLIVAVLESFGFEHEVATCWSYRITEGDALKEVSLREVLALEHADKAKIFDEDDGDGLALSEDTSRLRSPVQRHSAIAKEFVVSASRVTDDDSELSDEEEGGVGVISEATASSTSGKSSNAASRSGSPGSSVGYDAIYSDTGETVLRGKNPVL